MGRSGIVSTFAPRFKRLGLQGVVKLHGFVPAEELDAALAAAHLAVNLRNPTMGESSFSQLQIWDHALPTLVSQVAWYAKLPENAVAFVRPEHEVLDIQRHLNAFLADPDRFVEMGIRAAAFSKNTIDLRCTPKLLSTS